jgi:hypothetical protein
MRTVVLDFDKTLHRYSRGWDDGTIYDPPIPGAVEAANQLAMHCRLVVQSTRARTEEGRRAIATWLRVYGFPPMKITAEKEPATIYVDDRGYRFEGDWELALAEIEALIEQEEARRAAVHE